VHPVLSSVRARTSRASSPYTTLAVLENVKAFEVIPKLTPEILQKIEDIIQNKPQTMPGYRRPPLDPYGRR
jgi:hypothetical protein